MERRPEAWQRFEQGRERETREEPDRGQVGVRDFTPKATGGIHLLGQKRLSGGVGLWHRSGMAKRKNSEAGAAVALGVDSYDGDLDFELSGEVADRAAVSAV